MAAGRVSVRPGALPCPAAAWPGPVVSLLIWAIARDRAPGRGGVRAGSRSKVASGSAGSAGSEGGSWGPKGAGRGAQDPARPRAGTRQQRDADPQPLSPAVFVFYPLSDEKRIVDGRKLEMLLLYSASCPASLPSAIIVAAAAYVNCPPRPARRAAPLGDKGGAAILVVTVPAAPRRDASAL